MERIYTISEVTKMTGINESTLRNWEREFQDDLLVSRDEHGARIYKQKDMDRFKMISIMRKKGLSIRVIKDLLEAFKDNKKANNDASLEVATSKEITPLMTTPIELFAALQVLHNTLQNLPDEIEHKVQQELQKALLEHEQKLTKQIGGIVESRLEKHSKKKRAWRFW